MPRPPHPTRRHLLGAAVGLPLVAALTRVRPRPSPGVFDRILVGMTEDEVFALLAASPAHADIPGRRPAGAGLVPLIAWEEGDAMFVVQFRDGRVSEKTVKRFG